jgi:hypothetical protein
MRRMLLISELRRVALATLLGSIALIGTVEHVFGQDAAITMPDTAATGPDAVVVPAPAAETQTLIVQNGGAVSVIVLPAEAAGSVQQAESNALVPSYDAPLDNIGTPYSPMSTIQPWDVSPTSNSNVMTSDDLPLDNPPAPGSEFPNTPWKG